MAVTRRMGTAMGRAPHMAARRYRLGTYAG